MAVGVLLLSCPVRWCGSCPTHTTAVLASTAVMSHSVPCRVCGVWVVNVCLWCSCGGVSFVCSPLTVVVGGAVVDGGVAWWMVGGMVGKGGSVIASPSVCWCPPCHLPCGPVEWREWWVVCCPVFGLGLAPCIVPLPFTLSVPFVSFPFLFCLVLLCLLWVGSAVGELCPAFPFSFPPFVFPVTALLV